jgi:hypothetical protein
MISSLKRKKSEADMSPSKFLKPYHGATTSSASRTLRRTETDPTPAAHYQPARPTRQPHVTESAPNLIVATSSLVNGNDTPNRVQKWKEQIDEDRASRVAAPVATATRSQPIVTSPAPISRVTSRSTYRTASSPLEEDADNNPFFAPQSLDSAQMPVQASATSHSLLDDRHPRRNSEWRPLPVQVQLWTKNCSDNSGLSTRYCATARAFVLTQRLHFGRCKDIDHSP